MEDDELGPLPLPEHPELRDIAVAMESAGMGFEIFDARFRSVYVSSEFHRFMEGSADQLRQVIGRSVIWRVLRLDAEILRVNRESSAIWFEHNAPIMRRYLDPSDADFEEIFDSAAPYA